MKVGIYNKIRDHNIYLQNITVSDNKLCHSSFPIKFENIFTKYIIDDHSEKVYKTWNDDGLLLWQTQLNFAIFCATSACGISTQHFSTNQSLINSVYKFHIYYQVYRILKRMKVTCYLLKIVLVGTIISMTEVNLLVCAGNLM